MGSISLSSPFVSLTDAAVVNNQSLPSFGTAMFPYKYTGSLISFAQSDSVGGAHAFTFSSVPTDAVALEMWVNATGASDYLFFRGIGSALSNTGVLSTNITANSGGSARWVASGQHMVIPLQTAGTVPTTFRWAFGTASGTTLYGRYISAAAGFPYMLASTTEDALTGAAAQQTLGTGNATKYPQGAATVAIVIQVYGSTPMRVTIDGTAATATNGDIIPAGTYLVDFAKMGVAITALRMYLPTGTNVMASALTYA